MFILSLLYLGFSQELRHLPIPHPPKTYVCRRAAHAPAMSGSLDDAVWSTTSYTDDFVDIEGDRKPKPRFRTRVKMLWDDKYLYVKADIREPQLRASLTEHDSVIFRDNDFEIFIDPDDDGHLYSEFEMNALNTTWDLLLVHPYRTGGPAVNGWEIKGLRSAVHLEGRLNHPGEETRGWTAVIAFPWAGLRDISRKPCPPHAGDQWRINFSRVEWQTQIRAGRYQTVPGTHEDNWVWSPQGVVDMHRPDMWGVLQFTDGSWANSRPKPLDGWAPRATLFQVWEAESNYRRIHGRFANTAGEMSLDMPGLEIFTTPTKFEATLGGYRVDDTLLFSKL